MAAESKQSHEKKTSIKDKLKELKNVILIENENDFKEWWKTFKPSNDQQTSLIVLALDCEEYPYKLQCLSYHLMDKIPSLAKMFSTLDFVLICSTRTKSAFDTLKDKYGGNCNDLDFDGPWIATPWIAVIEGKENTLGAIEDIKVIKNEFLDYDYAYEFEKLLCSIKPQTK